MGRLCVHGTETASGSSTMSRTTSCPDLVHLRVFYHKPGSAPDAEWVRAHLAQCEDCRAIVAGFQGGDGNVHTLADEPAPPARWVTSSTDTMQVFRKTDVAVGQESGHTPASSLADVATMNDARSPLARADASALGFAENGGMGAQTNASTLCISADTSVDDSFQVAESVLEQESSLAGNSYETCYLPPDQLPAGASRQDSYRSVSSDSYFTPTKCDIPDGPLPKAMGLEGVTVPGYDILEELGRGGMGVVYKARHRRLQRLVALKMVLAGAHVGQAGLARFRAEAEAVAKLLHPNIVQIFETGEHEGRPFFSLEYVEGGSLDQQLGKSPTNPRGAAQFVETLARTMEVAHQRGIVHRDLKPANILLANLDSSVVDDPTARGRLVFAARRSLVANHGAQDRRFRAGEAYRRRFEPDATAAPSSARPVTWPPNKPGGKPGRSARRSISMPWARSSTNCWWAGRRSRRAIRSTRSARSSSKSRFPPASWSRACRTTSRRSA